MPQKKRRVSFNIPEPDQVVEDEPQIEVKIREEEEDETEEIETLACKESDSESDSEASSLSSDDQPTKDLNKSNNQIQKTQQPTENEDSSNDSDSESDSSESSSDEVDETDKSEETSLQISEQEKEKLPPYVKTFNEMLLDPRVERAIERIGWRKPTPVQSTVIPAAMHGRDILVSAPTGSGKTAAYAVPLINQICRSNKTDVDGVRGVVLVPTRELVGQVTSVLKSLCKYMEGIHVSAVTYRKDKGKDRNAKKMKTENGNHSGPMFNRIADIIVGTPASIANIVQADDVKALSAVQFVVVDEADLVLSYGYEDDARVALAKVPNSAQSMLLSATLEAEGMDMFKKLVLRRPLTISVSSGDDTSDGDPTGASHYFARLQNHKDRYLVTYAMLRLNVICGKVLIFTNQINSAFRLKLFLDQFKVKAAVLNSELPANSRMHCIEQFNAGVFDILIATDESKKDVENSKQKQSKSGKKVSRKRERNEKDSEFGLSRGVDFRDVAAVFNFDLPESVTSYTHRAGRTARAGKTGTVLSLVCTDKEKDTTTQMCRELGVHVSQLAFRMDQVEAFRYRVEDCLRLVTDNAVHGARLADVRREIINSEQLKDYFEDNPDDYDALQHNMRLAKNIPEHLAHIPTYLLPPALRGTVDDKPTGSRFRTKRKRNQNKRRGASNGKGNDPLKTFKTSRYAGSSRERFREKHGIKKKKKDLGSMIKKRKRTF